jgi:flagellar basal-body rod modification protein FlgD
MTTPVTSTANTGSNSLFGIGSSSSSSTAATAAQSTLSSAQSQTATAKTQLSGNLTTFLQLLTQQLKYQDPLSPMDTSQFTNQLVEYASVEQEININTNLESMLANQDNAAMATAANYLGQQATGTSSTLPLQNGQATFAYTTPANSNGVNIVIADSSGNIVQTITGSAGAGTHVQSWNGSNLNGGVGFTGSTVAGSTSLTAASTTTGLSVGQAISGPGLASGTTISAISGTTLTLSQAATSTQSGASYSNSSISPDGAYTLTVNSVGANGSNTQLDTAVTGIVTGVGTDPTNNQTELFMGSVGIDLGQILEVQAAGTTPSQGAISTGLANEQQQQQQQQQQNSTSSGSSTTGG